ncbi:metal-dependent transcriptional regulator [Haloplanus halophilus]|uniref:metal-dependent transcriptional regulator n=1 Tax=Haloplanus halophilus TaxID=2949993 RepID=UPI0020419CF9|nr:metal-dependent transcriptional regulator [Haloplanus sp. GDY1]
MSGAARYLLALYIVEQRRDPPVSSGDVADLVGRSQATATQMLQGLAADGLVTYEPYEGAALTEAGRDRAADLHETYVTLSWFFRDVLDLEDYEAEAMEMAGLIDPEVANRLTALLPYEAESTSVSTDDG